MDLKMAQKQKFCALEQLPIETKHAIMIFLPASSLPSLIRTSKNMYSTFKGSETVILSQALGNEIPRGVLFEAFVSYRAFVDKPLEGYEISQFLDQYLQVRNDDFRVVNLRQASSMSKIHACVEYFSEDFINKALAERPSTYSQISENEMARVQRAFYNFEIYRTLFRKAERVPAYFEGSNMERKLTKFFGIFSPWERNQLCCVCNYLVHLVKPSKVGSLSDTSHDIDQFFLVVCHILQHDVQWGALQSKFGVSHVTGPGSRLGLGLSAFYKMAHSSSYEERWNSECIASVASICIKDDRTQLWKP